MSYKKGAMAHKEHFNGDFEIKPILGESILVIVHEHLLSVK